MESDKNYSAKYERFLNWRSSGLRNEDGIIVGADITQEWILPWWWNHYRKHNSYPVAFVDFGMSSEKKDWCRERGELIPLRVFDDFVKERANVDPTVVHFLEVEFGKEFWACRTVWFKKPLAFLQTPFQRTIWIDLDCEIRGSVQKLFDYANLNSGFGIVKDQCDTFFNTDYPIYNSGVISYRRNLELVVEWAQNCIEHNCAFRGDQEVLSYLISKRKIPISEISPQYNWNRIQKDHKDSIILHWHGVYGKYVIRNQITVEELSF